ncbi:zf-HC2 domain-containing protein [Plebeiibacterium sediminum]|uniref:Zf-HC2 domain-containing protein n=1 Tax=Plebeiibacterium sediminum TaxID=2992112 RepID=A0AAE3SF22_9BACT|nr:hypothetical protein [Plebeiobacterium sediminum]MCW3786572.1 zf-HC2 domain-containing protein [Plebeiobacterium sediminum]
MNCSSCQKQLESFIEGNASGDIQMSLKTHLEECEECHKVYTAMVITNRVISQEKELKVNPFISTRIMEHINQQEEISVNKNFELSRILQPALLTASVALALFIGISAGNMYQKTTTAQNSIPEELMLMNDASMESLNLIITE